MSAHVTIIENILSANDQVAQQNRTLLDTHHVFSLNVMASPGAGKTSLVIATFERLRTHWRVGMMNADISTSLDADRAAAAGMPALQISTGGNCHLEAVVVNQALQHFPLTAVDLLIVENVGNLICPAGFKLGTHLNVVVASVPEGADKPYKYPSMYRGADVLIVNKMDVAPYFDFDMAYFSAGVRILNPNVTIFPVSCKTGEGLEAWIAWLNTQIQAYQA